jgi:hypothetical protein
MGQAKEQITELGVYLMTSIMTLGMTLSTFVILSNLCRAISVIYSSSLAVITVFRAWIGRWVSISANSSASSAHEIETKLAL